MVVSNFGLNRSPFEEERYIKIYKNTKIWKENFFSFFFTVLVILVLNFLTIQLSYSNHQILSAVKILMQKKRWKYSLIQGLKNYALTPHFWNICLFIIAFSKVDKIKRLTLSSTSKVSITVRTACLASKRISPRIEEDVSMITTTSRGEEVVVDT